MFKTYINSMKNLIKFDGSNVKRLIRLRNLTREMVVVAVQEKGYAFSVAQFNKMVSLGYIPTDCGEEILNILAQKLKCSKDELVTKSKIA